MSFGKKLWRSQRKQVEKKSDWEELRGRNIWEDLRWGIDKMEHAKYNFVISGRGTGRLYKYLTAVDEELKVKDMPCGGENCKYCTSRHKKEGCKGEINIMCDKLIDCKKVKKAQEECISSFVDCVEPVEKERVKVTDINVVVSGASDKPYYAIKYKKLGEDKYIEGYGSYNLSTVYSWFRDEFEVVDQKYGYLEDMSPRWLFERCKKFGIDVVPKKSRSYYISKLIEYDELQEEGEEMGEKIEEAEAAVETENTMKEMVEEPPHYKHGDFETIDEMIILFGVGKTIAFCQLNAWKYRSRAPYKGNAGEDMAKSNQYLKMAYELQMIRQSHPEAGTYEVVALLKGGKES